MVQFTDRAAPVAKAETKAIWVMSDEN